NEVTDHLRGSIPSGGTVTVIWPAGIAVCGGDGGEAQSRFMAWSCWGVKRKSHRRILLRGSAANNLLPPQLNLMAENWTEKGALSLATGRPVSGLTSCTSSPIRPKARILESGLKAMPAKGRLDTGIRAEQTKRQGPTSQRR